MLPCYPASCLQRGWGVAVLGSDAAASTSRSHRSTLTHPLQHVPVVGQSLSLPDRPVAREPPRLGRQPSGWVWKWTRRAGSAGLWLALYANGPVIIYSFGIYYNCIIWDWLI